MKNGVKMFKRILRRLSAFLNEFQMPFSPKGGGRRLFIDFFLRHRPWFIAAFQAALIFCSLVFAWLLRFEFSLPYRRLLFSAAPLLILIRLAAIARYGLLRGWWRFSGLNDALDILKAVAASSGVFYFVMRFLLGMTGFPRSIYVLEALLTAGVLAGVRLFTRALAESLPRDSAKSKRVVIIGAGFAGEMILREIERPGTGFHAVACLDDDESKRGLKLLGVPVVGTVDQLPAVLAKDAVDEVFIAAPSATGAQMQRIVDICERSCAKFKTVPALRDLIAGHVILDQLREVNLDDLLGRDPVAIDMNSVHEQLSDRVVLVTGAAGSIGSELCRQILEYEPATLLCLDQSETGIFFLRNELLKRAASTQCIFTIADIRDAERIKRIFTEHRPQVVFHAAAYKHVPLMEWNPHEAVENNVFAFLSLLSIAEEAACEGFVLISSDKAVNPSSVMGATKRICELIVASRPTNGLRCVSVRFGNVLGSSGSVVPVLQEQLRKKQPLTVTHPDIRRFFMTTREAVTLVLQAFTVGNRGDILVLDMGRPMRIMDLARNLIRLSGKSEQEVKIEIIGLREGEKLTEELFSSAEEVFPTVCERIRRIRSIPPSWPKLDRHLRELRVSLMSDGAHSIRKKIKEIVPEFTGALLEPTEEAMPERPLVSTHAAGRD
jgi:FlaA1/EpsC-like NDP-sugar epimerase